MHIIDMRTEEKQGDTPHSEMDLGRQSTRTARRQVPGEPITDVIHTANRY